MILTPSSLEPIRSLRLRPVYASVFCRLMRSAGSLVLPGEVVTI